MKAQLRPSLALLWIARFYAVWVLGFGLVRFISYSTEPDRVVIHQNAPTGVSFGTGNSSLIVYHHGPTASLFFHVLLFACLTFGLFMLHQQLGRLMVGVAAVGVLSMTFYGVFRLVYLLAIASSIAVGFVHGKLPIILASSACSVVIQFFNIWLALRPPQDSFPSSNPVNLLSPV